MAEITISADGPVAEEETLALYGSVGWSAYTKEPATLRRAIAGSSIVVTARDADGTLVGLARAVSDDATICYLQDILVRPDRQGAGIGRRLVETILDRFAHVRQTVLITDDEPGQRAFYEAMGFTEGGDVSPHPLRMFARFR